MEKWGEIYVFTSWHQFELAVTELAESGDDSFRRRLCGRVHSHQGKWA